MRLSGGDQASLLSPASESKRSAVPVEHEVAVDNAQWFGPEVDFADFIRLEAELDGIAGIRIKLHRFARHPEHLQYQPDRGRGICPGEGQERPCSLNCTFCVCPLPRVIMASKYCRDMPLGASRLSWSISSGPRPAKPGRDAARRQDCWIAAPDRR